MVKVYIGSLNPVKIAAVQKVFQEEQIIGMEVNSKVSNQPFSDEETIQGAINRAKELPQDGFRIGLEAGVQEHLGKLYLVNWGVLLDQHDNMYIAGGTRIPLPAMVQKRLIQKTEELAVIMDDIYHTDQIKHKEGAVGLFTANYVKRIDIFIHITLLLYGQYQAQNKEVLCEE
ncbi:MAG: DUF84 family protein [Bacilli bacterium]|jgi:inosine/xanthosine triphosphatase|nr:DUF84 family protein [Bacilli bacterium]